MYFEVFEVFEVLAYAGCVLITEKSKELIMYLRVTNHIKPRYALL